MTHDDRLNAVRKIREEADKLRLVCITAAKGAALLHVAYDSTILAPTDGQIVYDALLRKMK